MKIRPVGAELFHAKERSDGQTGRPTDRHDKAIRSFAKAPKKIENRFETLRTANGSGSTFSV